MRSLLPAEPGDVDLDAAYAVPPLRPGGRHVRVNFVTSADGAAEIDGRSGSLGGPAGRQVFRTLRWLADAVLVGAGTVRAENYGPAIVPPERQELRVIAGLAPIPPIVVVTGRLDLEPDARLFSGPVRPILLTRESAPADRRAALSAVAEIVDCGADALDATTAVELLAARGLGRVLCEGGPSLHASLARAGLVDELCLTLAPALAGPMRTGITSGDQWPSPHELTLAHVLEDDGTLFLRYLAGDPRPSP